MVVSEAKLLSGLIERVEADSSGSIYQAAQSEASQRGEAFFYVASIGAGVGDAPACAELREIAVALRAVEKMSVYMDGGKSLLKILDAVRDADRRLKQWLRLGRRDGAEGAGTMSDAW